MTDNELLARWQGYKFAYDSADGHVFTPPKRPRSAWEPVYKLPDYLNNDAAAMSLLDTLVEKEYKPVLCYENGNWYFGEAELDGIKVECEPTRRDAIIAACLKLAKKEIEENNNAKKSCTT